MSNLAKARTNKFSIGTAELRVGPLAEAMRLKSIHSIGLVDTVNFEFTLNSVHLLQGFPQKRVATAVTSEEGSITGTLREYSRRNLSLLFGAGFLAAATDVATTLSADAAADATSLSVDSEAGFEAGDLVVIYSLGSPGLVTVARVASTALGTITLDTNTPTLHAYVTGSVVFKSGSVPIGGIDDTKYFACQIIQKQRGSGRPMVAEFWKASVDQGGSIGNSADDFASTDLNITLVEPLTSEYEAGGVLEHLADVIPAHPMGLMTPGMD